LNRESPKESFGVIRDESLGQGRYQNSTGSGCPWLLPGMTPYSCNTLFMAPYSCNALFMGPYSCNALFMGPYLPQKLKQKKTPSEEGGAKVPRYSFLLTPFMKPICFWALRGSKVTCTSPNHTAWSQKETTRVN